MSIMMTRVGAVMKRAQRGLFGGKRILFGNTISHSEKRCDFIYNEYYFYHIRSI